MPALLFHLARFARLRQIVIWALIVALPVHSLSGVLQRVLGASHRHTAVVATLQAPSPSLLRQLVSSAVGTDVQALIDADRDRARPVRVPPTFSATDVRLALAIASEHPDAAASADPQPQPHTHDGFQRHVHDAHDATVVALGDKAAGDPGAPNPASSADAGAGVFPLPAAAPALAQAPTLSVATWHPLSAQPWHDHVSGPLERPPQT